MDYHAAFIRLYGAAGAALDDLCKIRTVIPELTRAIGTLQQAVWDTEDLDGKAPDKVS